MLLGYTRPIPNMLYNTSYYKILRHGFQEHVQVCINFQELQRGMEPPRMTLGMNFAYYTITEPNSWNLQTAKLGNNLSFPFQLSLFIILYCFRLFFFFLFFSLHGNSLRSSICGFTPIVICKRLLQYMNICIHTQTFMH